MPKWRALEAGLVRLLAILAVVGLIILVGSLLGCMGGCRSHTAAIADGAERARTLAQSSKARATLILEASAVGDRAMVEKHARAILADMDGIIAVASGITEHARHVRDVRPWWVFWLKFVAGAAGLAVAGYFLWSSGVGILLRGLAARLVPAVTPALTPRPTFVQAKTDVEHYERARAENRAVAPEVDKNVQNRRTTDPAYNAAFVFHKARL